MASVSGQLRANKHFRLWRRAITLAASLRSRSEYLEKVGYPLATRDSNTLLNHLLVDLDTFIGMARLDINTFKSHTEIPAVLTKSNTYVQQMVFPGAPPPKKASNTLLEGKILELMKTTSLNAKAAELRWLVAAEVATASHDNWFMVFNTLTVNDSSYDKVFGSTAAWRDYIRSVDRQIAAASYGSVRLAEGRRYHTYFAVVEAGTTTGRLHLHVLHFCKNIPVSWLDPNTGLTVPKRREIDALRGLWPHGTTTPIAVRYSLDDAFGRLGWRWPVDRDGVTGLKTRQPAAIAGYLCKYITKSYSTTSGGYSWRVKKTHNLGRELLNRLMSQLTMNSLTTLRDNPSIRLRIGRFLVPNQLLQLMASREMINRTSSLLQFMEVMDAQAQPSLLQQSRALIPAKGVSSSRSITSIRTETSFVEATSDVRAELHAISSRFSQSYYPESPRETRAIKTRA